QNMQSAREAVNSMTIGWNLGNTLDATGKRGKQCVTPQDWETSWDQPVTTPKMIHVFKKRGFNVIRIPVTWGPHLNETNTIDEAWMTRVNQIVDYVINEGMYCILNVHHDTGTHGWLKSDPAKYPEISKCFRAIWMQIAERFKGYGERLIFEGFNEMLDANGTWDHSSIENYTAINLLAQDFVDVVRRSGGNNEYRNLIITTYSANAGDTTLQNYRLPGDVHPGHLIGEIHFYDPQDFCFPERKPTVYTDEYRNISKTVINRAADFFDSIDVPLIIGEIAAFDKNNTPERVKFSELVASESKKRGVVLVWWMGLLDREKCKWSEPEIVDALMRGIGN
nr:glycoside hydrolase family 5 protein [Bacteroidales bacterium]